MNTEPELVEVGCDLCGMREARLRYRLHRGSIVRCRSCGFHYVNPRRASSRLHDKLQYWAEQDLVDSERLEIAFDATTLALYRTYLDRLNALSKGTTRRLLDIGCSTGAFLKVAREAGWEVEGLEAGKASSAYAHRQLGLQVHQGRLEDRDFPPESYDVIVLLEVLEHLESPTECLAKISRWLRPDGLLLLSTPNFDSVYRRIHGSDWWVVNCEDEHIVFFTPDTLADALRGAGLSREWLHVRGLDLAGIFTQALKPSAPGANAAVTGYHEARSRRQALKRMLASTRLLPLARASLRALDSAFSAPYSPLFGMGEQLVAIARRRDAS